MRTNYFGRRLDKADPANFLTVLLLEDFAKARPAVEATLEVVRTEFFFAITFTSFQQELMEQNKAVGL